MKSQIDKRDPFQYINKTALDGKDYIKELPIRFKGLGGLQSYQVKTPSGWLKKNTVEIIHLTNKFGLKDEFRK